MKKIAAEYGSIPRRSRRCEPRSLRRPVFGPASDMRAFFRTN
jgi:hypothetical protein